MRINGQLWRMFLTYDGVVAELNGHLVGVFPDEVMATEAVVQTLQTIQHVRLHVRSVA